MDDLERYGDYNEIEEENIPKENKFPALTVKILVGVLVVLVCATVGARLFLFNYYPSAMQELYITDSLADYASNNGNMELLTQKIRIPYDHATQGNFFCDNLLVVKDAGHFLIDIMPLMFIPAAVGLMVTWDVLQPVFLPLAVIAVVSTVLVMAVTGKVSDMIIHRGQKKEGR